MGAPVDGVFSEKQMRLLTECLHTSWRGPADDGSFVAMANVGLFYNVQKPAIVPDVLLSVGVTLPDDLFPKRHRSYFIWEYGKAPEVVIQVVSNKEGEEDTRKLRDYARIGVRYYVIYDPHRILSDEALRAYRLEGASLKPMAGPIRLPELELGLQIWQGRFEDHSAAWLRWVDARGELIPTGKERAETAEQRAARLAEKLRALGVDPEAD
jgi:Uma2 family endonuclease